MNEHQIVNALEALKNQMSQLEQQLVEMRRVVAVLLEKVPLDFREKDELLSILELTVAKEPEESQKRVIHERSIQELLDESQDTPRREE
jgi:regulator of replication initiation timing